MLRLEVAVLVLLGTLAFLERTEDRLVVLLNVLSALSLTGDAKLVKLVSQSGPMGFAVLIIAKLVIQESAPFAIPLEKHLWVGSARVLVSILF